MFNRDNINKAFIISPPYSPLSIYIPPEKINIEHIKKNGKLLDDNQIGEIWELREKDRRDPKTAKQHYYRKKELNQKIEERTGNKPSINYSVIFSPTEDNIHENMSIVYPIIMGEGGISKIKYAQMVMMPSTQKQPVADTDFVVAKLTYNMNMNHSRIEPFIDKNIKRKKKPKLKKNLNLKNQNKKEKQKSKKRKPLFANPPPIKKTSSTLSQDVSKNAMSYSALKEKKSDLLHQKTKTLNFALLQEAVTEVDSQNLKNKTPDNELPILTTDNEEEIVSTLKFKQNPKPNPKVDEIANQIQMDDSEAYNEYKILKTIYKNNDQIFYFEQDSTKKGWHEILMMPLIVDSITLEELLDNYKKNNKRFSIQEALLIGLRFLKAYNELTDELLILHLDIKKENVMINPGTLELKIIDFNVSAIGQKGEHGLFFREKVNSGRVRGTPAYAHPSLIPYMLKTNPDVVLSTLENNPTLVARLIKKYPAFLPAFVQTLFRPIKKKVFTDSIQDTKVLEVIDYITPLLRGMDVAKKFAGAILSEIKADSVLGQYLIAHGHASFKQASKLNELNTLELLPPVHEDNSEYVDSEKDKSSKQSDNTSDINEEESEYINYTIQKEMYSASLILEDICENTHDIDNYFLQHMKLIIANLKNNKISLSQAITIWENLTIECLGQEAINNKKRDIIHIDCNKLYAFIKNRNIPDFGSLKDKEIVLVIDYHDSSLKQLTEIKKMFKEQGLLVKNQVKIRTPYALLTHTAAHKDKKLEKAIFNDKKKQLVKKKSDKHNIKSHDKAANNNDSPFLKPFLPPVKINEIKNKKSKNKEIPVLVRTGNQNYYDKILNQSKKAPPKTEINHEQLLVEKNDPVPINSNDLNSNSSPHEMIEPKSDSDVTKDVTKKVRQYRNHLNPQDRSQSYKGLKDKDTEKELVENTLKNNNPTPQSSPRYNATPINSPTVSPPTQHRVKNPKSPQVKHRDKSHPFIMSSDNETTTPKSSDRPLDNNNIFNAVNLRRSSYTDNKTNPDRFNLFNSSQINLKPDPDNRDTDLKAQRRSSNPVKPSTPLSQHSIFPVTNPSDSIKPNTKTKLNQHQVEGLNITNKN